MELLEKTKKTDKIDIYKLFKNLKIEDDFDGLSVYFKNIYKVSKLSIILIIIL